MRLINESKAYGLGRAVSEVKMFLIMHESINKVEIVVTGLKNENDNYCYLFRRGNVSTV